MPKKNKVTESLKAIVNTVKNNQIHEGFWNHVIGDDNVAMAKKVAGMWGGDERGMMSVADIKERDQFVAKYVSTVAGALQAAIRSGAVDTKKKTGTQPSAAPAQQPDRNAHPADDTPNAQLGNESYVSKMNAVFESYMSVLEAAEKPSVGEYLTRLVMRDLGPAYNTYKDQIEKVITDINNGKPSYLNNLKAKLTKLANLAYYADKALHGPMHDDDDHHYDRNHINADQGAKTVVNTITQMRGPDKASELGMIADYAMLQMSKDDPAMYKDYIAQLKKQTMQPKMNLPK